MKVRKPPQSGSLGDVVAKRNRYGQYETKKPATKYRHTAARRRACGDMTTFSQLWNEITEGQREVWRGRGAEVHSRPRLGISGPLTGQNLIVKINTVRCLCGYEPVMDAPLIPRFALNPCLGLTISSGEDGPVLKLRLSERPTQDIMVFGSPPRNAGRASSNTYVFLGLLPAGGESEREITRLYVKKYGVPRAGSRVFIRTWPQENGWEGRGLMRIVSAIVPARERAAGGRKGRRAGAKAG